MSEDVICCSTVVFGSSVAMNSFSVVVGVLASSGVVVVGTSGALLSSVRLSSDELSLSSLSTTVSSHVTRFLVFLVDTLSIGVCLVSSVIGTSFGTLVSKPV